MNFDSHQTTGRESEAEEILKEISETLDRNDLTMSEGIPAEAEEEDTGAKERRLYTLGVRNSKQLREIAKNKQPYLVQDYIPPRSVGMLVGEWGIGKSPLRATASDDNGDRWRGQFPRSLSGIRSLQPRINNLQTRDGS